MNRIRKNERQLINLTKRISGKKVRDINELTQDQIGETMKKVRSGKATEGTLDIGSYKLLNCGKSYIEMYKD